MKKFYLIALLTAMPALATAAHAATIHFSNAPAISSAPLSLAMIGAAPEPASVGILAAGGVALLMRRRKSR